MAAATTSGGIIAAAAAAAQEEVIQLMPAPLPPADSRDKPGEPTGWGFTLSVSFSSGNPRIEETRGIMHLYPDEVASSDNLPIGRKPLVCVIAVPNHMTYADFCRFCGAFIMHMAEMRIVRTDGVDDQYSVIIKFDNQISADGFYQHFNGRQFSSLEGDQCSVRYTIDVQYTGSIEHTQSSATSSAEEPSCPVCLERLDQDTSGILTTICNHSFHCSCISKWTDSSCPVCRYCQQQPETSTCSVCGTSENVWICVICGFIGCGRYKEGHAIRHWKETQHCYSLELETQRVWDYVGDNYVHRLIQSKTDGKLVELNFHCAHADDKRGSCEYSEDLGFDEALLNSKLDTIAGEYNDLLTSQLDNQRKYYESLVLEIKEETEKEISEAIKKAVSLKLQKFQIKLDKCIEEKKFMEDINENLLKNEDMWKAKVQQLEEREQAAVKWRDEKIQGLEEQLGDLIMHIESQNVIDEPPKDSVASEITAGTVLPVEPASSSSTGSNEHGKKNRRRN
ncbi:BRAP2 RING ZnF UBP domain-containing protein 2-like [Zingiber officinale]|uniref:BRAP2 RING ZnF UBP domain-containing protein 2-like n=1 Tax=Zingiber officinale TaxID=94328 RepID=UPI001C4CCFBB|nr:BRAP2 RING ZnF UBP domain-containing protein 2-like [Zingiber officinale]